MFYYFLKYTTEKELNSALKREGVVIDTDEGTTTPQSISLDLLSPIPTAWDEDGQPTDFDPCFHANIVSKEPLDFGVHSIEPKRPVCIFAGYNIPNEDGLNETI
jgi:hypothetical protein